MTVKQRLARDEEVKPCQYLGEVPSVKREHLEQRQSRSGHEGQTGDNRAEPRAQGRVTVKNQR